MIHYDVHAENTQREGQRVWLVHKNKEVGRKVIELDRNARPSSRSVSARYSVHAVADLIFE